MAKGVFTTKFEGKFEGYKFPTSIAFSPRVLVRLDTVAKARRTSRSSLVRELVAAGLDALETRTTDE